MKQRLVAWSFVGPSLLALGVFFALPVFAALLLSFTDFDLYALADTRNLRVVWFDNYIEVLRTPLFWKSLLNTLYFVGVGVPLSIAASLGAALLINSPLARCKGFFRTALFAPVVTTVVAVALIWRYLFHTRYGLINYALAHFGIAPIDWLGDPHWSMPAIIAFAVWKNFGYNMVILLAGLQSVPVELYEAARIDGASSWRQFRHITLPSLRPVLLLVAIITVAGYFQLFAEPYVMTRGDPLQSTVSVLYYMFQQGFEWWNLGRATAIAFLLFALTLLVTRVLMRSGARRRRRMNAPFAKAAVNGALLAAAAIVLFPLLWMLSVSLMQPGEASVFPPPLLPAHASLANYHELFERAGMGRYLFNSLVLATAVTLISLCFNLSAGYAFAKLEFAARERLFQSILGALLIPAQVGMIPLFLMMKWMHLVNTYGGVIVPCLTTAFGIFLVRQYARSIPNDLIEAARIDGAGEWRIFLRIVLPLLKPVIVTLTIFSFLATWNDFMWPLIVLSDQQWQTAPVAIAGLSREHVQDNELMMAGSVVTILPVLALFLVLQRHYIQGLLLGSVKG